MVALPKITNELRESTLRALAFGGMDVTRVTLKANGGGAITSALRDELLAKCAANQYVELEMDIEAYSQDDASYNRNYVRIDNSAMKSFGSSGKGKPFLRDHNAETMSTAGTILSSETEDLGGGKYIVRQTVKLTAPWAVDLALRDLISTVSVSWAPTGPIKCSACDVQVLTSCYHLPGDRLSQKDENGVKRLVRNRAGDIVCQWIYTKAEMVECSLTPIPAVKTAHIESIRASLSLGNDSEDESLVETLPENIKMTTEKDLEAKLAETAKQLVKMESYAALNDAERNFYRRLEPGAQMAFLSKTAAQRVEEIKPIYTSLSTGRNFTTADDPAMVEMAKQQDADRKSFQERLDLETNKNYTTRASVELAHLPGTVEGRAALLRAIDDIKDEKLRGEALAACKANDERQSVFFKAQGTNGAVRPQLASSPEAKLEKMAKDHMVIAKCSYEKAYAVVMETPEGTALYTEAEAIKQAARNGSARA